MAPFFKKKRQSTAIKPQQAILPAANGHDDVSHTPNNSEFNQKSRFAQGFNNSPIQYSTPAVGSQGSPNPGYQGYQSNVQHFNTANIPPESTFSNQHQLDAHQAQRTPQQAHYRQQYSHSATQPQTSNFQGSPFQGANSHHRDSPQRQAQYQYQYQSPPSHALPTQYMNSPTMPKPFQSPQQTRQSEYEKASAALSSTMTHDRQQPYTGTRSRQASEGPWRKKKLYNSPFPRYRHTASSTTAENGCMFIMGGLRDDNVYGDIWMVAPIGNDATPEYSYFARPIDTTEGVPAPRVCHNSVLIGNAFIVYGGDTIQLNDEGELDNNLYFFNINSMKWTTPSPSGSKPCGRYGHTITVVTFQNNAEDEESTWSSYLYLFGGQLDDERFNDMWCFDLSNFRKPTTKWRKIYDHDLKSAYQPPPLANHTITVYDGKIYVYGGSTMGGELSNALYCFNPVDETWSTCLYTSQLQAPAVEEHSSILYQNYLVSYGGKDSTGSTTNEFVAIDLNTFQAYIIECPENGSPGNRSGHSMTYDMINEKILIMGGDQLNLESSNSSRDDVIFDGIGSPESGSDLMKFTSIDPASLEYDTTYIYEFDVSQLSRFLNSHHFATNTEPVASIRAPSSLPLPKTIDKETQVELGEEVTNTISNTTPDVIAEEEVVASTPLRTGAHLSADSTYGSIQTAKKVNMSTGGNGAGVKRVDSINVHKNRRTRSTGSSFNEVPDAESSSNPTSPPIAARTAAQDHLISLPRFPSTNTTQDDFKTPASSSVEDIIARPQYVKHQNVGSKVELVMNSDDEEEGGEGELEKENHGKMREVKDVPASNGHAIPGAFAYSSSSSLLPSQEKESRAKIPSAISDATMNSFLDNYTNPQSSSTRDLAAGGISERSDSSSNIAQEISNEQVTPIMKDGGTFDREAIGEDTQATPKAFTENSLAHNDQSSSSNNGWAASEQALNETKSTSESGAHSLPHTPLAARNGTPKDAMHELYERLNDLKRSLNEKMGTANAKIIELETTNAEKDEEISRVKRDLAEKTTILSSLTAERQSLLDLHASEKATFQEQIADHEKSIQGHTSQMSDLNEQLKGRDLKISHMASERQEVQEKMEHYEALLNDRFMNLDRVNKLVSRQKDYLKEQQIKAIAKEETLLKKINELMAENQNLKVDCEKFKRLADVHNSFSADDDSHIKDSDSATRVIPSDEDEFNDSSIQELSQGYDRLLQDFKTYQGPS